MNKIAIRGQSITVKLQLNKFEKVAVSAAEGDNDVPTLTSVVFEN
jgi:hypothetical protein